MSGSEHGGELGEGLVHGSQVDPREQGCQRLELGLGTVAHRLGEQLGDQEHGADAGDRAACCRRFLGEQGADASPEPMTGYGRVDQHIGDQAIGVTDASLVVLARRYETRSLLTLDRRHFSVVRPLSGGRFTLIDR